MQIKIYCLYNPYNSKIRYIGRTKSSLKRRLSQHICKANKNYSNSHKENWIRSLLKNGIRPKIKLLKTLYCSWLESHLIEKQLIEKYYVKHSLVNGVDAGPGNLIKNINQNNEIIRKQKIKEYFNKEENKTNFYNKIYCYDSNGNFVKEYKSVKFASDELSVKKTAISNHINRFDNYKMNVRELKGYFFSKFKKDNRKELF